MRDVHAERGAPAVNGARSIEEIAHELLAHEPGDAALPAAQDEAPVLDARLARKLAEAGQDRSLAAIASLMVRATAALEAPLALLSRRLLGWATLAASCGLAAFAIANPSWERLAVVGVFMLLGPWLVRKVG